MLFDSNPDPIRIGSSATEPVVVYGTQWCGMTQQVRRFLDRSEIPYQYIDLDLNPAAKSQLRWLTGGYTSHPTVYIGGRMLIEPSLEELKLAAAEAGYY